MYNGYVCLGMFMYVYVCDVYVCDIVRATIHLMQAEI